MSGERPDITHPDNHAAYVEQCRFVLFWFDQMFKRVASHNAKSALEARDALQTLLIHGVYELLGLVRGDKDSSAAQWAAKLLAAVANEAELCETNEVYRQEKATLGKLFRTDVWFPKSPLYQAIHRELWFCQWYRRELIWPTAQRYLPNLSVKPPKEYLPLMKLPKLSPKTWQKWAKPLWRVVKMNNPDLLEKLREQAQRTEGEWCFVDGKSKMKLKSRKLHWNAFEAQFKHHLKALASKCGVS